MLDRRPSTCLTRALVLQRWHAWHGRRHDVVIGVAAPGPDFHAHAWLDGDGTGAGEGYAELLRRPAP